MKTETVRHEQRDELHVVRTCCSHTSSKIVTQTEKKSSTVALSGRHAVNFKEYNV